MLTGIFTQVIGIITTVIRHITYHLIRHGSLIHFQIPAGITIDGAGNIYTANGGSNNVTLIVQ